MSKILVVDDKEMMRDSVATTLSRKGYSVVAASGGTMAIEKLRRRSVDAVVTDPPYGLGFMGKEWDRPGMDARTEAQQNSILPAGGAAAFAWEPGPFQRWTMEWATEALRVAKPGAYLLAFGGTRTVHRLTVALKDAGWNIRDLLVCDYA